MAVEIRYVVKVHGDLIKCSGEQMKLNLYGSQLSSASQPEGMSRSIK